MPTITRCRIASDADYLSKVQLAEVSQELKKHCPKLAIEAILTDERRDGDGHFSPTSPERMALLMRRLLAGEFDALVLNAAYLPARLPSGLAIGAITSRRTPFDVLISSIDCILDELPHNATIVANDAAREAQLLYYRSDLRMVRSAGSVDSVIQKVKNGQVNGAVLAAGDVERLHKQDHVTEFLTCSICIPTAGQGSLAVLVRSEEEQTEKCFQSINDAASYSEITAERAFLDCMGAQEHVPTGVLGSIEGKALELEGMIALPDGRERIHAVVKGSVGHEAELGEKLSAEIFEAGGVELMQEIDLI